MGVCLFSHVPVMNPWHFKTSLDLQTFYQLSSQTIQFAAFLIKTLFHFYWPNQCLSFLTPTPFPLWTPLFVKSYLVYFLHPLEGGTDLEVLVAVTRKQRNKGKFHERNRKVKRFLFYLSLVLYTFSEGKGWLLSPEGR